ncbi:hypothetical protein ABUK73_02920 [Agrobacterium sp. BA1120]|uniref:hypothetical protein n=1 Tax=Agrobacterium sp. BA1120 TaxID=3228927 RepID=UPI0013AFEA51
MRHIKYGHELRRLRHAAKPFLGIFQAQMKTARFLGETVLPYLKTFKRDFYGLPKMYVKARKAAKPARARIVTAQQDFCAVSSMITPACSLSRPLFRRPSG